MYLELKELFDSKGQSNEKVFNKLLEALKNNAITEMDYLKFKKSYMSLCQLGMDEAIAAKSAFVTSETMGFNKEKLFTSIHHYQNILKKEKEAFAYALKNQITNNVESKQLEIKKLHDKKLENIAKIEKLKDELSLMDEKIKSLDNDIKTSSEKIEDTRQQFVNSISILEEEIEEDLQLFQRITS
ncbi:MAG: hypothetical protein IPN49_08465 [Saprospiraceae bacterium]|nr:hypothetical protein [Saprospiraceae bacterium]MBK7525798.1 hypothetical protein [Saprospiraceae bacterium]MBK8369955.1 hypothetical protein [Saprospiraceae bacterium]MBK8819109.1 hypothetical protein [Saprospiraceae bacterium]MBK8855866.1 hypothetical protein [Saprospiraceae bacterium]